MNKNYELRKGDRCYVYGKLSVLGGTISLSTGATIILTGVDKAYCCLDHVGKIQNKRLYIPNDMISPLKIDAQYCIRDYQRLWKEAFEEAIEAEAIDPYSAAEELFDMTAPATGIIGYYLHSYGQQAYKEYAAASECKKAMGTDLTEREEWILKMLKKFCNKETSPKKSRYTLRSKLGTDQYAILCDTKGQIISFDSYAQAYDAMCRMYVQDIEATGHAVIWQVQEEET